MGGKGKHVHAFGVFYVREHDEFLFMWSIDWKKYFGKIYMETRLYGRCRLGNCVWRPACFYAWWAT